MKTLGDQMGQMGKRISRANMPTTSTTNSDLFNGYHDDGANGDSGDGGDGSGGHCALCGQASLCGGLGVVRYDVEVEDPRFGKLFRCPNNTEASPEQRAKMLRVSNLDAFADKTFATFDTQLSGISEDARLSLQTAYNAAANYSVNPDGWWLMLEGTYGTGKTHLAAAIGNERIERGDTVLFVTVPDLLDHLRSTYAPNSESTYDETFERVRNSAFLILDDLGTENPSNWAKEKLFQILNHRYSHRLPTIITTNIDLDLLDGRIRSRLMDISIVRRVIIAAPDYRSAMQSEHSQLQSSLSMYANMTFDNFDVRTNLTHVNATNLSHILKNVQSYAEHPEGWLMLLGPFGSGKTHLAAAVANSAQNRGEQVMFITVPDLLDHLRYTFSPDSPVSFDRRFQVVRNTKLLVLDDLGTESATPWAKEKLFQLLNHRYVAQLSTVI
ncbi:MAG: ATP-binding protein, partial [Burkholderiales bacterium]|nr:ATP-binding protein [Anaerolineae bacterium]